MKNQIPIPFSIGTRRLIIQSKNFREHLQGNLNARNRPVFFEVALLDFCFLFIHIYIYSLNNYINTYKRERKSIKIGTHKNKSLDIKMFGISRKQKM